MTAKKRYAFLVTLSLVFSIYSMEKTETMSVESNPFEKGCRELVTCAQILEAAEKTKENTLVTQQKIYQTLQNCSLKELTTIYQHSLAYDAPMVRDIASILFIGAGQAALNYKPLLKKLELQLSSFTTEQLINIYRQSNQTKLAFASRKRLGKKLSAIIPGERKVLAFPDDDTVIFNQFGSAEISRRPFPHNYDEKFLYKKNIFVSAISPNQTWLLLHNKEKTRMWTYEVPQEKHQRNGRHIFPVDHLR